MCNQVIIRIAAVSLRVTSKIFPKLCTGFSVTDLASLDLATGFSVTDSGVTDCHSGIWSPSVCKRNLSSTFPLLRTRDLHLAGLNDILAHDASLSSPLRSQWHPGTAIAVTVRSSMKARIGGWLMPYLDRGPLHSTSAALTSMFIARANSVTDIV